ncbi:MAG: antibiotic biosynthesis monooxygenase family protein [Thermomicrobiales bacterium]
MMTVITETTIQPGNEAQWDQAFEERIQAAKEQPGWHALQVLIPENAPNKRIIVGTWEDRAAWERWHTAGAFRETRQQLNQLGAADGQEHWYTVASMAASED